MKYIVTLQITLSILILINCADTPIPPTLTPTGYPGESTYQTLQFLGDFNNWNLDDDESIMVLTDDYQWALTDYLTYGNYEYKFVTEKSFGDPLDFGTMTGSSELTGESELAGEDSAYNLRVKIPVSGFYTISLNEQTGAYAIKRMTEYQTAYSSMQLVGSFNEWNLDDRESFLSLKGDYQWKGTLTLPSGDITFKFVPNSTFNIQGYGTTNGHSGLTGTAVLVDSENDLSANAPSAGVYAISFNEKTGAYTIKKQ